MINVGLRLDQIRRQLEKQGFALCFPKALKELFMRSCPFHSITYIVATAYPVNRYD